MMDDGGIRIGTAGHHIVAYGWVIRRGLRIELEFAGNQSVLLALDGTDAIDALFL